MSVILQYFYLNDTAVVVSYVVECCCSPNSQKMNYDKVIIRQWTNCHRSHVLIVCCLIRLFSLITLPSVLPSQCHYHIFIRFHVTLCCSCWYVKTCISDTTAGKAYSYLLPLLTKLKWDSLVMYTMSQKTCQLLFCSVFLKYKLISIETGMHVPEGTLSKSVQNCRLHLEYVLALPRGNCRWQIEPSMQ